MPLGLNLDSMSVQFKQQFPKYVNTYKVACNYHFLPEERRKLTENMRVHTLDICKYAVCSVVPCMYHETMRCRQKDSNE